MNPRLIDLRANVLGCHHITWREVLILREYRMYSHPACDDHLRNLIEICQKFEKIRSILGDKPMHVVSGYRPRHYNESIGGAKESAHMEGMALDLKHSVLSADECRMKLLNHLTPLGIRMENLPGSNWIHIDTKRPRPMRFFKP